MTYDAAYKVAQKYSDLPIIIDGPHVATGKSTLCHKLRDEGKNVCERWEIDEGEITLNDRAFLLLIVDEPLPSFHKVR